MPHHATVREWGPWSYSVQLRRFRWWHRNLTRVRETYIPHPDLLPASRMPVLPLPAPGYAVSPSTDRACWDRTSMFRTFSRNTPGVGAGVSWQRHIHVSIVPLIYLLLFDYLHFKLLDCYRLSQISRLVYIHPLTYRNMISKQLERYRSN